MGCSLWPVKKDCQCLFRKIHFTFTPFLSAINTTSLCISIAYSDLKCEVLKVLKALGYRTSHELYKEISAKKVKTSTQVNGRGRGRVDRAKCKGEATAQAGPSECPWIKGVIVRSICSHLTGQHWIEVEPSNTVSLKKTIESLEFREPTTARYVFSVDRGGSRDSCGGGLAHMPRKGENTLASRTTVHAETAGGFYDPVSLSVGGRNAAKALHSLVVVCLGAARRGERVGASGIVINRIIPLKQQNGYVRQLSNAHTRYFEVNVCINF
ncbi:hypothetical protein HZH66_004711 [Vespula vulgaris]|uniref:Uncharacterized protein n=1 Tax=Vespula vulgaris TaxID=7454 RepID=A0A834K8K2_VESVU|nr:hypothetical protein HZH66_004711 [Vespula vulgaris]